MKLSLALLGLIGLTEAGKKKGNRAQTTTSSTTFSTTTSTSTMSTGAAGATDGDPGIQGGPTTVASVVPFETAIAGKWSVTAGGNAGENINVMLNSDGVTATVVFTNNAGDLVLRVLQATLDSASQTIMVNGVAGTLQQDGTVLWADGTVWSAGPATLTTTTTVDPNAGGGVAPTDAYGGSMGGSQYGPGSGSGGSGSSGGSGTGDISGDPHVRVQIPGQQAICYDIHGDELDYVSLLYDANSKLEINGQLSHVKANKSRLSAIGFLTPAGIEIGVFPDKVTIGYQGQIEEEYDLEDYMKITTDDATVEILSRNEAKHKGVLVELEDGSLFHVADKDFKASMKLEILRSDGLTGRMTGVLGQTIQPKDYIINPDGSIAVEDRFIMSSSWDAGSDCHRIGNWDVRTFLGHSVYEYAVPGIFSTIDQAWLNIQLQSEAADPK